MKLLDNHKNIRALSATIVSLKYVERSSNRLY